MPRCLQIALLLLSPACGLRPTPLVPPRPATAITSTSRRAGSIVCVSRKQLPQGLIDWGCDEELWSQVRNKKGLLDLLKKGDEERGRARIQKCREIVEEEEREALETKLFVLKQEGELVVARRSGMLAAYAAKSAAFNRTATTAVISESISLDGATVDAEIEARLASLRARQAEEQKELLDAKRRLLQAEGELAVQRREANKAAAAMYEASGGLDAAMDNATLPSAEEALVNAAIIESLEQTEAAINEAEEVTEEAVKRVYSASPVSAFLPPLPTPPKRAPVTGVPAASGSRRAASRAARKAAAGEEGEETVDKSIDERLKELDELRELGMITEVEYQRIKPQLLMGGGAEEGDAAGAAAATIEAVEAAARAGALEADPEVFKQALRTSLSELAQEEGMEVPVAATAAAAPASEPDPRSRVRGGRAKQPSTPMPTAPPAGYGGEITPIYQGESSLAPALSRTLALLDLYDPTAMTPEEQDKVSGAIATGTAIIFPLLLAKLGFIPDLLFSAVFGGGISGYCALRKDVVGKIARDVVGGTANLAVFTAAKRAQEIEDEYEVTREAQERLAKQIESLVDLQERRKGERRDR